MLYFNHSGYGYSKRLCEDVVSWFVSKYLSRYKLEIEVLHRGLKREYTLGYCDVSGETYRPRSFLIEIDTHLNKEIYIKTLLHELYHVLQWVRGELKFKASKRYYMGECVDSMEYWKQGHEIAAHHYENALYQEYTNNGDLTRP